MFSQLFETVPDALIVVDDKGLITVANHQAEQLFGYPAQGLVGLRVEQLMPEAARERHSAYRAGYMAAPRVRPMGGAGMALVGQRRDGAQFPVEIALSPLRTDQSPSLFLASIRDISETQRARQAMARARYDALVARIGQQALEASTEEDVIAALPDLLAEALRVETVAIVFLREGQQLDIRAAVGFDDPTSGSEIDATAWAQLANSQPLIIDDLAKHTVPLPVIDGASGSGAIVPLLDRGRVMGALITRSHELRRFDHDALHLLQSVANLLAALIQRRRTEEQLAHSQRLDAIGQLTGGIAHDFNNLLTVMSGSLQLLESQYGHDPEAGELIGSALRSAARGAELTRMLLAFARRQRLSPSIISPARVLRDLEEMMRRTLGDAIHLQVECDDAVPSAYADASLLDSALLNLALNARDAMPNGGQITLTAEERWMDAKTTPDMKPGHYVAFAVADTGHGMTPETLARAIEPFYTTKQAGRGSGLGLSMVYGFVEQSGGQLQINSRPGLGTRVTLCLPVASAISLPPTSIASSPSHGAGETVLIVEDEPAVRDIAVTFVKSLGYRVHAVGSAAEAIDQLATDTSIALLFSDVMLGPGMNGTELAQAARRQRPELAILLTSGYEDSPALASSEARSFELLRKPYRYEDLAAALRRGLNQPEPGP